MSRVLVTAVFAVASGVSARAQTGPRKPKVPPGQDPGGVAVAIIGAGVDYRRPAIAARLARDGEGEMIGWDVIDDDAFPLETAPATGRSVPAAAGTSAALSLLETAPAVRLIAVRVPAVNALALGGAMAFVAQTPARIVVILGNGGRSDTWDLLARGIARAPQVLVVAPVTLLANAGKAGLGGLANVVSVAGLDGNTQPVVPNAPGGALAQVGLPVDPRRLQADHADVSTRTHHLAAIVLAGLAARLAQQAPEDDAVRLKARLLAQRRPLVGGPRPAEGWFPDFDAVAPPR